jgi:hypothetical protein
MSALGHYGPIGSYGPLGVVGPIGDNIWNSSSYIEDLDWHGVALMLTENGGPLSARGPLGHEGVLNPETWTHLPERAARPRSWCTARSARPAIAMSIRCRRPTNSS